MIYSIYPFPCCKSSRDGQFQPLPPSQLVGKIPKHLTMGSQSWDELAPAPLLDPFQRRKKQKAWGGIWGYLPASEKGGKKLSFLAFPSFLSIPKSFPRGGAQSLLSAPITRPTLTI